MVAGPYCPPLGGRTYQRASTNGNKLAGNSTASLDKVGGLPPEESLGELALPADSLGFVTLSTFTLGARLAACAVEVSGATLVFV